MTDSSPIRRRVAVLGATGLVGQRLVRALADHPWFELGTLAASARSAGRPYEDVVRWGLPGGIPTAAARSVVRSALPGEIPERLVFSALGAGPAREIEPAFARDGRAVVSNASAFRAEPDVPLLVPEVNADHAALIDVQRRARGWSGFIATNPNCSVIGLVTGLAALHRAVRVERVVVTTLQAISGAGYPGVPSLDVVDNVVPGITGEEEKLEREPAKILGTLTGDAIEPAAVRVSPHTHRVPVVDGHLMAVSVGTGSPLAPDEAARLFRDFRGAADVASLPSAPARPIAVLGGAQRPQPRLDRDAGGGMTVSVGRVRHCVVLGLAFELLVHNTVRGAAGGTLLVGELLTQRGAVPWS